MEQLKKQYYSYLKKGLFAWIIATINFWLFIMVLDFAILGKVIFYITNWAMIYYFVRVMWLFYIMKSEHMKRK